MLDAINNPYDAPASEYNAVAPPMDWTELLFSFEGRIGRATYWGVSLGVGFLFGIIAVALFFAADAMGSAGDWLMIPLLILVIPFAWINIAVEVKRWHDQDKSGWWYLIGFIPYVGGLIKLVMVGFLPGTEGANSYGPPPA